MCWGSVVAGEGIQEGGTGLGTQDPHKLPLLPDHVTLATVTTRRTFLFWHVFVAKHHSILP